jgi:hypothetical protein
VVTGEQLLDERHKIDDTGSMPADQPK